MIHHCTRGCRQIGIQSLLIMNCCLFCFFTSSKEKICPKVFLTAGFTFSVLQHILSSLSCLLPPVTLYYQQSTHVKTCMRHEHCCEESWVPAHVASTEPCPLQSQKMPTLIWAARSLELTQPRGHAGTDAALNSWVCALNCEGEKRGWAGSVFHHSLAWLHLSWYMGNFLKVI